MSINERKTEDLIESCLRETDYYSDSCVKIEKQSSENPRINKLLSNASKSGNGAGRPEFIIQSSKHPEFIIIIECKGEAQKHESVSRNRYADFAVDGALLYASFLAIVQI